jgi:hypothetical protein
MRDVLANAGLTIGVEVGLILPRADFCTLRKFRMRMFRNICGALSDGTISFPVEKNPFSEFSQQEA